MNRRAQSAVVTDYTTCKQDPLARNTLPGLKECFIVYVRVVVFLSSFLSFFFFFCFSFEGGSEGC